ncbi:hypothetical protein B1812_18805 [Methylocystis bryophila]|uniref:Lipoprotein n=1 Tax=Methylocystis bryophila TaxID=655015 RepID=A0A1W6MZ17_9HYPH|nr:hypothetical protein B1812_18805 [Methylocystis bryophila]
MKAFSPVSIWSRASGLDHAALRRHRLNAENVINSESVERALCEKPVFSFSRRALAAILCLAPLLGGCATNYHFCPSGAAEDPSHPFAPCKAPAPPEPRTK